jgi:hypothetical protein
VFGIAIIIGSSHDEDITIKFTSLSDTFFIVFECITLGIDPRSSDVKWLVGQDNGLVIGQRAFKLTITS